METGLCGIDRGLEFKRYVTSTDSGFKNPNVTIKKSKDFRFYRGFTPNKELLNKFNNLTLKV